MSEDAKNLFDWVFTEMDGLIQVRAPADGLDPCEAACKVAVSMDGLCIGRNAKSLQDDQWFKMAPSDCLLLWQMRTSAEP